MSIHPNPKLSPLVAKWKALGQYQEGDLEYNLHALAPVERFFAFEGGLSGYQAQVLDVLHKKPVPLKLYAPEGVHVDDCDVVAGIEAQEFAAELWPVGGAGDRLGLMEGGQALPAALFHFLGRTLLEGLVRDLYAREWLFFKLFGRQLVTPVGLMTSQEKDNHARIARLFEGTHFFGRPNESLRCFMQPQVPVVDREGNWQYDDAGRLQMKPGGHGVIWKLALESGIFDWFKELGRKWALVRQINNPIAATDNGIIAFLGFGAKHNKAFGFLSCQRLVGAAEGMNVVMEKDHRYAISNVEYSDFARFGLTDRPKEEGSSYSAFPSNTNILFANIDAVARAARRMPMPGPLLNFKPTDGKPTARLETMMQNLGEAFTGTSPQDLPSFILFAERLKTISVIKNPFKDNPRETAVGAFADIQRNMQELFALSLPCTIVLHPALGPLWSIIRQKVRFGTIAENSEIILDIAEVDIEHLSVNGSLHVTADAPLGKTDEHFHVKFSEKLGRLRMHDVEIHTKLIIELNGFAELDAQDCLFTQAETIQVPDGHRLTIRGKKRKLEPIHEPSWTWKLSRDLQLSL